MAITLWRSSRSVLAEQPGEEAKNKRLGFRRNKEKRGGGGKGKDGECHRVLLGFP